jgi:hypothetical protein
MLVVKVEENEIEHMYSVKLIFILLFKSTAVLKFRVFLGRKKEIEM